MPEFPPGSDDVPEKNNEAQPRTSDLTVLLEAGFDVVLHVGEYQVHLWRPRDEREWSAMVCWFGDGTGLAYATGATPAEALWNVSRHDGDTTPYPGDFAGLPERLRQFTDALWDAAAARARAGDALATA